MIKLWLIRHGKTEGNKLSRYIGTTDEPLCQEGTEFLHKMDYPKVQAVYVSPLKRCVQTAEILFPGEPVHIIEELAECDFGEFENKNYKELEGNPHYQEWIDSNGTLPFPGGESREGFKSRNLRGFDRVVSGCDKTYQMYKNLLLKNQQDVQYHIPFLNQLLVFDLNDILKLSHH